MKTKLLIIIFLLKYFCTRLADVLSHKSVNKTIVKILQGELDFNSWSELTPLSFFFVMSILTSMLARAINKIQEEREQKSKPSDNPIKKEKPKINWFVDVLIDLLFLPLILGL